MDVESRQERKFLSHFSTLLNNFLDKPDGLETNLNNPHSFHFRMERMSGEASFYYNVEESGMQELFSLQGSPHNDVPEQLEESMEDDNIMEQSEQPHFLNNSDINIEESVVEIGQDNDDDERLMDVDNIEMDREWNQNKTNDMMDDNIELVQVQSVEPSSITSLVFQVMKQPEESVVLGSVGLEGGEFWEVEVENIDEGDIKQSIVLPTMPNFQEDEVEVDNEAVEACVNVMVNSELEQHLETLQQDCRGDVGAEGKGIFSGSEEEDDDDDAPKGRKRNNSKSLKGKGPKTTGRAALSGDAEHAEYRKQKVDPFAKCPPPAPKKIRGGRKSILKNTIQDNTVPEGEVQKVCAILSNRKSLRTEPNRENPLHPFNQHVLAPLVDYHIKNTADTNSFRASMLEARNTLPPAKIQKIKYFLANCRPFRGMEQQLYYEQLTFALTCFQNDMAQDPRDWLKKFAILMRSARYKAVVSFIPYAEPRDDAEMEEKVHKKRKHDSSWSELNRSSNEQGSTKQNFNSIDFKLLLQKAGAKVEENIASLIKRGTEALKALRAYKQLIDETVEKKGRIEVELDYLHDNLSNMDPKYDEMSVTGIRQVKTFLEPPYFKLEDGSGGITFYDDPDLKPIPDELCFSPDVQKWTTKDLKALKACIKESIIARKTEFLEARYFELLDDSDKIRLRQLEHEGKSLVNLPPVKRKRGRPTKEEVKMRDKYGVINPVLCKLPNGCTVSYEVKPKDLSDWRTSQERRWKGMSYEAIVKEYGELIDWTHVAQLMMLRTKKPRYESDCELAFKHEIHPTVNTKRWGVEETKCLKELHERYGNNWALIAQELNAPAIAANKPIRTAYLAYFRYRNRIVPPEKVIWTIEMDMQVKECLEKYPAQWRKIAASLNNDLITNRDVLERYKKNISPILKTGAFSRVEDCLLLLTIERLKPFLAIEGNFGAVLPYLPWRYETTWRDRANNLFNDWIVPWTIEEDRLLMTLATKYNRNWQKISEEFSSFKNRKGCLTRFKILTKNLKEVNGKVRFQSLEEYHEAYSMTRYNVFQYRHLKDMIELLKMVKKLKVDPVKWPLGKLSLNRLPTENQLRHMLLVYDRKVLKATIKSLKAYSKSRDEYWEKWVKEHGTHKRTFDRRTFHRDDPQSVASAMHIRGLTLKPKDSIKDITDFEDEIYMYFARFTRTKTINQKTKRPYLPSGKDLIEWKGISRIIATKVCELNEDETEPCNKKWLSKKTVRKPREKGKKAKNKSLDLDESMECEETKVETATKGEKKKKRRGRKRKARGSPEEDDILVEASNDTEELPEL